MPLSFPPSTLHPGNPRGPSDNDPGNDDDENPFDNNNSNNDDDDDDDDDNNDYEDANNGTQEDWAVQVFNTFKKDCTEVVFMQSYFKGMALEWFELDLLSSSNPRSHPLWMDNWTEFIIELQSTFSPHNPVADAENQLNHLQLKENQQINKYMVEFNQLTSQVSGYGNGAFHHQFYSGLPNCIKDEICHVGKPHNLDDLHYLAQEIDVHYWEHKEEVQHANRSSGQTYHLFKHQLLFGEC
ncbi:hypothetical protein ID866_11190 [Astraeus odoratus]|nr:hypothetical protein ID866_11190 [Astraeus odoratus]